MGVVSEIGGPAAGRSAVTIRHAVLTGSYRYGVSPAGTHDCDQGKVMLLTEINIMALPPEQHHRDFDLERLSPWPGDRLGRAPGTMDA